MHASVKSCDKALRASCIGRLRTETKIIKAKGFRLGLLDSTVFERRVESTLVKLSRDSWLVEHTDSVKEAHDLTPEEFVVGRFIKLGESHRALDGARLVQQFLMQHQRFASDASQSDDITLIAIKWIGERADIQIGSSRETTRAG